MVDHLNTQGVLVWSGERSDSLGLLPQHRRVLLDRGILVEDPQRLAAWKRFGKVLRQKRELLIRGEGTQLPAWNKLFSEAGAYLITSRKAYVAYLQKTLEEIVESTGLRWPGPRLAYRGSPPEAEEGEEAFYQVLESIEGEELRRGRCLTGPQRDEVQLLWGGREMRRVASQGEKKSAGLSLLAAQAEIARRQKREPIVLLDDCDAELDRDRLERLWTAFEGVSQVVATSNREEAWKGVPVDHVRRLPGEL
jgi:DNA replication and repair protein RecF